MKRWKSSVVYNSCTSSQKSNNLLIHVEVSSCYLFYSILKPRFMASSSGGAGSFSYSSGHYSAMHHATCSGYFPIGERARHPSAGFTVFKTSRDVTSPLGSDSKIHAPLGRGSRCIVRRPAEATCNTGSNTRKLIR